MQKPVPRNIKFFIALLLVALAGIFGFKAIGYISGPETKERPPAPSIAVGTSLSASAVFSVEMLNVLEWHNVDELIQVVGTDREKMNQVIELTAGMENPPALYLRGFLSMIAQKPRQALTTFDLLTITNIPAAFLYPLYRLQRQMHPEASNRYLGVLNSAIAAGIVSPLVTARVQAQEGNPNSALSSYLQTDPGQWVSYDLSCLKKIDHHSGLSSEIRRMIFGALKSGRVSSNIDGPLRRMLIMKKDLVAARELKRNLTKELIQGSSTGKIAVSSAKRLLETRRIFMQRDYQSIIDQHQDTNPMALPNESVLILFLSGVSLENRLEMDRWGQEIKRRYPAQEVIDWVSELITSAT